MMIRPVQLSDAAAIRAIYQPYVTEQPLPLRLMCRLSRNLKDASAKTLTKFPYLVAEVDGKVVG